MSLFALIGRADSHEQIAAGKIVTWIIIGPLWASFVYLCAASAFRKYPWGRMTSLGICIVVWIIASLTLNWWEDEKYRLRMDNRKQYQEQAPHYKSSNQNIEPTGDTRAGDLESD